MRPIEIPGATRVLAKPPGWTDEQCSSLAIRDVVDEDGPAMQSLWTLDAAERAAIAAGADVQLHICGTGHPPVSLMVVGPVAEAADDRSKWPDKITPELSAILGMMNFVTGPVAHLFQRAGYDVPAKCEAEQAFVLHRLLGFWFKHGAGWAGAVQADLDAVKLKVGTEGERAQGGAYSLEA